MKEFPVAFISLCLIITISGISCTKRNCGIFDEKCLKNSDCCTHSCSFSIISFTSYCKHSTNIVDSVRSYFLAKEQEGTCSYKKPENKTLSNETYKTYGLNAANNLLPHHTKVEVNYNGKKVLIEINDHHSNATGAILELSEEAAKVLDIENEGEVFCIVSVPFVENNWYIKGLSYLLPYICIMFLIRFI